MIREIRRVTRDFLAHYPGHAGVAVVIVHSPDLPPTPVEPGFYDVLRLGFDDDLPSTGAKVSFTKDDAVRFVSFLRRLHEASEPVVLLIQDETADMRRASALALFAHAYSSANYSDLGRSQDHCRSVLAVLREICPDVTVVVPVRNE